MSFFRKPFGYEPILTKEDINGTSEKKVDKASDWKSVLYRIWQFVDEQRALLIVVLALVLVSSVLALAGPYLVGRIIDDYITNRDLSGLSTIIIWLAVIYVGWSVSLYLQNYWMIGIAQQTIYRLRTTLISHLQRLSVSFFDRRQHGELMSRVTNDIENVSQTLNTSFIQVFSSILTLIGTTVVMLLLSPLMTVITLTIVPVMFVAIRWITKRTSKLFKEQQKAVGELNGMIEETISGQRIVKAFSQEERMMQEFSAKSTRLRTAGFWALTYSGFIPKVMNLLNNLSFTMVAAIGGVLAFYDQISIGEIVIFTEYARQFTRPLNDLSNQFNTVLSAIAGAERVFKIIDEEPEADTGLAENDVTLKGHVEFKDVVFRYNKEESQPIIDHVSFEVRPGQTAALVGATGAGKTTIMQLLARFYETDEGAIRIDGIDIKDIPRKTLRSQMAFVLQDSFLFEMTVMENIRYGKLDATDEEVMEAAKQANAHDFIMKLPNGYQTVLNADGGEISQGQKQLLSIARALVADPAVLLLDEATSSIDTVTEMKIQEALERLMEGRTSFVIAHRLNTVRQADMIFVMEHGRLVEGGPQQQLLEQKGRYYQMLMSGKEENE
ncbi:multidrug ABC transporter ATP-binding protein [Tetzosporium hominis]|uniref:Multidrug ABC transporter ATP-binding protein n=1 Tax=Tetzosporium hominis TaxID=2020506 RepID=A0A264W233_9BACL|nr:ABC transporter ATP-binding protein [Tetzosporium hominis]OZS77631.1 multidrug ABC transporter ATP-binding protein [Tetzosporium hominis]